MARIQCYVVCLPLGIFTYFLSVTLADKSGPEEAGIKAAAKVSGEIMAQAKLDAELAAKLAAKEVIDKALDINPLPPGVNASHNHSRFVEDTEIHEVISKVLTTKKKITASFWKATG